MPARRSAGSVLAETPTRSQYLEDLRASPGGLSGRWVPKDVPLESTSKPKSRVDRRPKGPYVIYGSGCNSCGELGFSISSVKFTTFPSCVPWPGQLSSVSAAAAGRSARLSNHFLRPTNECAHRNARD